MWSSVNKKYMLERKQIFFENLVNEMVCDIVSDILHKKVDIHQFKAEVRYYIEMSPFRDESERLSIIIHHPNSADFVWGEDTIAFCLDASCFTSLDRYNDTYKYIRGELIARWGEELRMPDLQYSYRFVKYEPFITKDSWEGLFKSERFINLSSEKELEETDEMLEYYNSLKIGGK